MATAKETQTEIRRAMEQYRTTVLHERYFDPVAQSHKYPYPISSREVLRIAGIKSRATLLAEHHKDLRRDLKEFIKELKKSAGKKKPARDPGVAGHSEPTTAAGKIEQLSQTIGALQYRVLELEKQLKKCREQHSNVVEFRRRREKGRA